MKQKFVNGTTGKVLRSALAAATALAFTPALAVASSAPATSPASAASETDSTGSWDVGAVNSTDVVATLGSDNVLRIECNGGVTSAAMRDFTETNLPGWYEEHHDDIVAVEIGNGVTNIGNYAFGATSASGGYTALTKVDGGNSLATIGNNAFDFATASTLYDFTDCALTSVGAGWLGSENQSAYSNGIVYVKDKASAELAESNAGKAGKQRHAIAVTTGATLSTTATYTSTTLAGLNNTDALQRTGYTFNNWYTDEAYSQTYSGSWATGGTDRANDGLVVYARWNPNTGSAVDKPVAVEGLTYNGSSQTGVVAGTGYTLSGDVTGTNAGSYTATVSLADGYTEWSDSSAASYNLTWSIAKATPTLTVSSATVSIDENDQGSVTVNYDGDGALSVTTSDDSVAEATVTGTTVTIESSDAGTATITVSASATANYNAASTTFSVVVASAANYTQTNGYEPYQGWQGSPWYSGTRSCYVGWTLYSPLSQGVTGYDTAAGAPVVGSDGVKVLTYFGTGVANQANVTDCSAITVDDSPNYFNNIILDPIAPNSDGAVTFDLMVLAAGGASINSGTFYSGTGGIAITTSPDPDDFETSAVYDFTSTDTTVGAAGANWCRYVNLSVAASDAGLTDGGTYYLVIKKGTPAGHTTLNANIVFEFTYSASSSVTAKTWSGDLAAAKGAYMQGVNGGTKIGIKSPVCTTMTTDLTNLNYWHNKLTSTLTLSDGATDIVLHADGSGSNWQTISSWSSQGIAVYDKTYTTISDTGAITTTDTVTHSIAYSNNSGEDNDTTLGYNGVKLHISGLSANTTYYLVVPATFSASSSPALGKAVVYEFTVA